MLQNEKHLHPIIDSVPTLNQIKCEFQFIAFQCEGSGPIKMSAGIYVNIMTNSAAVDGLWWYQSLIS